MPTRRLAAEVRQVIQERDLFHIGDEEWRTLLEALAPITEHRLRSILRESGVPLSPLVEGVRISSFDDLERTLRGMLGEYERAVLQGDRQRERACRRAVIAAKDRTRMGARSAKDPMRREQMREMVDWMLVWLENPPLFPQWAELRKRAKRAG